MTIIYSVAANFSHSVGLTGRRVSLAFSTEQNMGTDPDDRPCLYSTRSKIVVRAAKR